MVDSKAIRKTKLNQVLILVTEVVGLGASAGIVTIAFGARFLFKR